MWKDHPVSELRSVLGPRYQKLSIWTLARAEPAAVRVAEASTSDARSGTNFHRQGIGFYPARTRASNVPAATLRQESCRAPTSWKFSLEAVHASTALEAADARISPRLRQTTTESQTLTATSRTEGCSSYIKAGKAGAATHEHLGCKKTGWLMQNGMSRRHNYR